ncbi:phosphotransferase enzyme family protein [Jeotgalibacillus sp. R-1-5s-1]|uniref:phosphotransferase enzyme family protein n=1 Tax=Jeotgalibacillus sp. R-1-5s-1 TaxID=2555897 RepID=UPI00141B54CF|nr:phosphotransferase [Jeotgalibacillus sp. R-1-5s-1]
MKAYIAQWLGLNENRIKPTIGGYQNHVYKVEHEGKPRIIRLRPQSQRTKKEIKEELTFIRLLNEHSVNAAAPVLLNGTFIHELRIEDKVYHAVLFERAPGTLMRVLDKSWNDDFFRKWGAYIGSMHLVSDQMKSETLHRRKRTVREPDPENILSKLPEEFRAWTSENLKQFTQTPTSKETYGFIHHDFHQGNLFVDRDSFTAFDFDDAMMDWKMYDLAVTFYHAIWQGKSFRPEEKGLPKRLYEGLLNGYVSVHPLTDEMVSQMEPALAIRDAFLYPVFSEKWTMTDWQKTFLADMENRLRDGIPYIEEKEYK